MVFALILPIALVVLAAAPGHRNRARALWAVPLNLAFLALLSTGVFALDTYRNDGRSRWETGQWADHVLYVVTVGFVAVASVLLVGLALRTSSGRAVRPSLLLTAVGDAVLGVLVTVAYSTT